MRIIAKAATQPGKGRGHNEDFVLVDPALSLYVVSDGMGGHAAGEVASAAAAEAVRQYIGEHQEQIKEFDESAASRDSLLRLVEDAVQFACREVFRIATSEHGRAGMGTTLTAVVIAGDFGVMGHVGDSRLYLQRGGRTDQLSEDHTYSAEAVKRGLMTAEEADAGPYARVVTRAVGTHYSVRVDTLLFDVLPGDRLLLSSTGIHRRLDDPNDIGTVLDDADVENVPDRLIERARAAGSTSDASALVVAAESGEEEIEKDLGRASEVSLRIDTLRRVVIFRHLDMREVCKVLNIVRVEEFDAGKVLIREDENSYALYAILSGTLKVERGGQLVRTMTAGDHFGEMALFNHRPRSASVIAQTSGRVLVMELARFNDLLRTEPVLSVKLLWCFSQVLSLRLDDVTGTLYDDPDTAASVEEELKSAPFKVGG